MNPRRTVLLDSGPLIGLFNENDDWHQRCTDFFGFTQHQFVITEAVISEVIFKIQKETEQKRVMQSLTDFFRKVVDGDLRLHRLELIDFSRIMEVRRKYRDQRIDFADLTLVIAAERLEIGEIVTIDERDFRTLRWATKKAFKIISPER